MYNRFQNNLGFASIVEVVVTAIIFMLAATGVYSSISNLRPEAEFSTERLAAAYAAQEQLQNLRLEVDQPTWDTGGLSVGAHNLNQGGYTFAWTVTNADYLGTPIPARRVVFTVTY